VLPGSHRRELVKAVSCQRIPQFLGDVSRKVAGETVEMVTGAPQLLVGGCANAQFLIGETKAVSLSAPFAVLSRSMTEMPKPITSGK
jgi:hypothetical protein